MSEIFHAISWQNKYKMILYILNKHFRKKNMTNAAKRVLEKKLR